MKTYSVLDLQLIPELSHLRMIDFVDTKNDSLIAPFLKVLGYDLDYPLIYSASQHRTLSGKVVVGYIIAGDIEHNASFLDSSWATVEDRIIVSGYSDLGFSDEMATMLSSRDYTGASVEGFSPELTNPDEANILMQIKILEDILLAARGSPFKQDGSRKTLADMHVTEVPEKQRKKHVKVVAT